MRALPALPGGPPDVSLMRVKSMRHASTLRSLEPTTRP
jgi:hypothetical protein